jgi:hypothetical protein
VVKRLAAGTVMAAYAGVAAAAIGASIRGPFADKSAARDVLAGAGIIGAALAVRWAQRELGLVEGEIRDAA